MPTTIRDRLGQQGDVLKNDSAFEGAGHIGKPKGGVRAPRGKAQAQAAERTPDSPREVHKDGFTKAQPASTKPAAPAIHAVRKQLEGAENLLKLRQDAIKQTLAATTRGPRGDAQLQELLDAAPQSWPKKLGDDARGAAEHLLTRLRAPEKELRASLEQTQSLAEDVGAILRLHDHELADLGTTREQLPARLDAIDERLNANQEQQAYNQQAGYESRDLNLRIFADRQEIVRLNGALNALNRGQALIDQLKSGR